MNQLDKIPTEACRPHIVLLVQDRCQEPGLMTGILSGREGCPSSDLDIRY